MIIPPLGNHTDLPTNKTVYRSVSAGASLNQYIINSLLCKLLINYNKCEQRKLFNKIIRNRLFSETYFQLIATRVEKVKQLWINEF